MREQENMGPVVVDANMGLTNCISINGVDDILLKTFTDIANLLGEHCGPYSGFAMIPNSISNAVVEPTFTKDGINIVRALEFANPLQTYIKQILAYLGSRIERAGGDGTTSAMIICACALRELFRETEELSSNGQVGFTYDMLVTSYAAFLRDFSVVYERSAFHVNDDPQVIYNVAYSQAYTSSHGDKDLSDAVAQLYSDTPKMAWDFLYIDKATYESEKRYSVEVDNNQYTIDNVQIMPRTAMTEDLGSYCIRNNIKTYVSSRAPVLSDFDMAEFAQTIDKAIVSGEPMVVVCPNDMDGATLNHYNELFNANKNHKVVFFLVNVRDAVLNDITCLLTLMNNFNLPAEAELSFNYNGNTLRINGIYDNPTDSFVHPYYGNNQYTSYADLVKKLDTVIARVKGEVGSRTNNQQLVELQKYRLKLTVARRTYFRIGGSAYDAAANTDVAIDAMLATKHTLTHGFVAGSSLSLYRALSAYTNTAQLHDGVEFELHTIMDTVTKGPIDNTDTNLLLRYLYATSFQTAIVEMLTHMYGNGVDDGMTLQKLLDCDITYDVIRREEPQLMSLIFHIQKKSTIQEKPFIIQPKPVDIELLKRFGELALKIVKMRKIIVPGGMCSTPQNRGK